ncbi:MAG: hypothetical protein ACXAD7_03950 [Candidatus Kariarchaeaceae archaeon]|jgi:hypothetical protein
MMGNKIKFLSLLFILFLSLSAQGMQNGSHHVDLLVTVDITIDTGGTYQDQIYDTLGKIIISATTPATFINCAFKAASGIEITTDGHEFTDSTFIDTSTSGFFSIIANSVNGLVFNNNSIHDFQRSLKFTDSNNIFLKDTTIVGVRTGIDVDNGKDFIIQDSNISIVDGGGDSIYISNSEALEIDGGTFTNSIHVGSSVGVVIHDIKTITPLELWSVNNSRVFRNLISSFNAGNIHNVSIFDNTISTFYAGTSHNASIFDNSFNGGQLTLTGNDDDTDNDLNKFYDNTLNADDLYFIIQDHNYIISRNVFNIDYPTLRFEYAGSCNITSNIFDSKVVNIDMVPYSWNFDNYIEYNDFKDAAIVADVSGVIIDSNETIITGFFNNKIQNNVTGLHFFKLDLAENSVVNQDEQIIVDRNGLTEPIYFKTEYIEETVLPADNVITLDTVGKQTLLVYTKNLGFHRMATWFGYRIPIVVREENPPVFVSKPSETLTIEEGSEITLKWEVTDDYPGTYTIIIDGVSKGVFEWESSVPFSYNLGTDLAHGTYYITINVGDVYQNVVTQNIVVTVTGDPSSTSTSDTSTSDTSTSDLTTGTSDTATKTSDESSAPWPLGFLICSFACMIYYKRRQ